MAILSKNSSYQDYLKRIQEYRSLTNEDQIYSDIQARTEKLFHDLKNRDDQSTYFRLMVGICVVTLLAGIISLSYGYYLQAVVMIIGPLVAWYTYHQQLKPQIEAQQKYKVNEQLNLRDQLMYKVQYLLKGIQIKIYRIQIVRFIYMIVFPILMIGALYFVRNEIEVNKFILLVLAFLLGSIFWYYYFKDELDELEYQHKEFHEYHQSLILQIHSNKNTGITTEEE